MILKTRKISFMKFILKSRIRNCRKQTQKQTRLVFFHYFSLALIRFIFLMLSLNRALVYQSGNVSLECVFPKESPYPWHPIRNEFYTAARSRTRAISRRETRCRDARFGDANWKLLLTSRLNLPRMNAREQIRVESTIRDNYGAVRIKAISDIKLKASFIPFSLI